MNLSTVLNALMFMYFTKVIMSQETNNGVCNTNSETDDIQCALQNIQNKLEAQALTMIYVKHNYISLLAIVRTSMIEDKAHQASTLSTPGTSGVRRVHASIATW